MSPDRSAQNLTRIVCFGIWGGWGLFTLMVIAISWAGTAMLGRKFELGGAVVWNVGWILWAGATFGVADLARRFPIARSKPSRGIALHVFLGLLVANAILAVEFGINSIFQQLWPHLRPTPLIGFFVYKFHVYFLVYWMVLGATQAYDYYVRYRRSELLASQLEARLAQAQLHALKTQLHPHFLFNTHHAIVSLMLKNENRAAIKMLTRLSDLLRMTLQKTDQQTCSFREELEALELYLGIQKERHRERLTVHFDIDPKTLPTEVPCLLLQPIVENAFKHGLDPLPSGAELRVHAWREGHRLCLSVIDNGPGVGATFDLENEKGLGLRNTQARLERLYGADHRLEIRRGHASGTEVQIALPWREFQPAAHIAAVTIQEGDE